MAEVIAEHLHQALAPTRTPPTPTSSRSGGRGPPAVRRSRRRPGRTCRGGGRLPQALGLVDDPGVHAELLFRAGKTAALSGLVEEGVGLLDRATSELRALGRGSEALLSVSAAARALAKAGQPAAATALGEAELRAFPADASDAAARSYLPSSASTG